MSSRPYIIVCGLLSLFCSSIFSQKRPISSPNPWRDDYRDSSAMQHYKSWGTYNVHDPSCKKFDDTYYLFSTDAIYRENKKEAARMNVPMGYIQVRTSKDLVHWNFNGWAFAEIPAEAKQWVLDQSGGRGATNIWAPYILKYKNKYRLYYCVSAFGQQTSYIGMAESDSLLGKWTQKGCVVKTKQGDQMNAIDPSIGINPTNGEMWMHYGSYFGGLFAVQLNPENGMPLKVDDKGHLVAKRANSKKDNLEAPEIIYNPNFKKYYLFTSYDPLMTTYNVRVGRSDKPEGPFLDFFGNDLRDTINHYPLLTYPYQFKNHAGWAGVGHCSVFENEQGEFFMAHQGRLSPENQLMDLHIRALKWTKDGWPVTSPERFAGEIQLNITTTDIVNRWEVIRLDVSKKQRNLEAGQILWGENLLNSEELNTSQQITLTTSGKVTGDWQGRWQYNTITGLKIVLKGETIQNLIVFAGHDWENQTETLLFAGLDHNGRTVWGKLIK